MDKVKTNMDGEFSIEKALRICPTNRQADAHNKRVLEYFRKRYTETFRITAQDQLVVATRRIKQNITLESIISNINKTGGLPEDLEIFIRAKVMLRYNIEVTKGLVNGAIGNITAIIWIYFHRGQLYKEDIPAVKIDFGSDGIHILHPKTIQFSGHVQLRNCWMTDANYYSNTVDQAVVYLSQKFYAKDQAYVSLNRVKSLDGLQIEELDNPKLTGKKPCNNEVLKKWNAWEIYSKLTFINLINIIHIVYVLR